MVSFLIAIKCHFIDFSNEVLILLSSASGRAEQQEQRQIPYGWLALLIIVQRRISHGGCCVNDLSVVLMTFHGAFCHWELLLQSMTGRN